MDTIYGCCAGLDVHEDSVQVCVRTMDQQGKVHEQVRAFGTTTGQLLALYDWLSQCGVTHVAMESTGVYWGWAASHAKNTYLAAQFHRLVGRRGKKRALMAVGHSILVSLYHMMKNGVEYRDLGAHHYEQLQPERLTRHLVKRLEALGHRVILAPAA